MDSQHVRDAYKQRPECAADMPIGQWVTRALRINDAVLKSETNVNTAMRHMIQQEYLHWDNVGFSYHEAFNAFNRELSKGNSSL